MKAWAVENFPQLEIKNDYLAITFSFGIVEGKRVVKDIDGDRIGIVCYSAEDLTADVVSHEMVHCFQYFSRWLKNFDRNDPKHDEYEATSIGRMVVKVYEYVVKNKLVKVK